MTSLTAGGMLPLLLACLAGGLGAGARFLVDGAVKRRTDSPFPWGILLVNVTGSFALGAVTAALPATLFVIGAGLLGGYTTFSTAMLDALAEGERAGRGAAIAHVLLTFVSCAAAAGLGLVMGAAL